jgi:hypothetical protein
VFVTVSLFRPSLIFVARLKTTRAHHLTRLHSKRILPSLPSNIRLGWKGLAAPNTLAYFGTAKKIFMIQGLALCLLIGFEKMCQVHLTNYQSLKTFPFSAKSPGCVFAGLLKFFVTLFPTSRVKNIGFHKTFVKKVYVAYFAWKSKKKIYSYEFRNLLLRTFVSAFLRQFFEP